MRIPIVLALASLLAVGASGCRTARPSAPTRADLADLADPAPQPSPATWAPPEGCVAAVTPHGGPAFDCEDGSFTLEQGDGGADPAAVLERNWHAALSMLEIIDARIGATDKHECAVDGRPLPCLRVPAQTPDGARLEVWLAVGESGGQLIQAECTDMSGGAALHPVCAHWLSVPALPGP